LISAKRGDAIAMEAYFVIAQESTSRVILISVNGAGMFFFLALPERRIRTFLIGPAERLSV
jgi:hypothetical protein